MILLSEHSIASPVNSIGLALDFATYEVIYAQIRLNLVDGNVPVFSASHDAGATASSLTGRWQTSHAYFSGTSGAYGETVAQDNFSLSPEIWTVVGGSASVWMTFLKPGVSASSGTRSWFFVHQHRIAFDGSGGAAQTTTQQSYAMGRYYYDTTDLSGAAVDGFVIRQLAGAAGLTGEIALFGGAPAL